jgi:hypothetical protein
MPYVRKSRDLFVVQMHTAEGWEDVTASYDRKELRSDVKAYRDNSPEFPYRLNTRREKIT